MFTEIAELLIFKSSGKLNITKLTLRFSHFCWINSLLIFISHWSMSRILNTLIKNKQANKKTFPVLFTLCNRGFPIIPTPSISVSLTVTFFDLWVFSLFKSSMVHCNSWGCKESDMDEQLKNSRVRLFATPWTVAYQAPPSMGFFRQEYWSGLPFPSPGDLPYPGIKPGYPAFQADALTSEPPGKPKNNNSRLYLALGNPGYDIKKINIQNMFFVSLQSLFLCF